MAFSTIEVEIASAFVTITINRIDNKNSINQALLLDLNRALDDIETLPACRIVIIQGKSGFFCTGMDFAEAASLGDDASQLEQSFLSSLYMQTIKRLTLLSRIVVSKIDGQVMAGGVGIVAASDLVIATGRSQFSLSEALWGLLPGCVTPYLIRRIGFQNAYKMSLTTMMVNAQQAHAMNLVDELTEIPENVIRQLSLRLMRLETETIKNMKQYFRKMWIISEAMENVAVDEMGRLASSDTVIKNIRDYLLHKRFPWEK